MCARASERLRSVWASMTVQCMEKLSNLFSKSQSNNKIGEFLLRTRRWFSYIFFRFVLPFLFQSLCVVRALHLVQNNSMILARLYYVIYGEVQWTRNGVLRNTLYEWDLRMRAKNVQITIIYSTRITKYSRAIAPNTRSQTHDTLEFLRNKVHGDFSLFTDND